MSEQLICLTPCFYKDHDSRYTEISNFQHNYCQAIKLRKAKYREYYTQDELIKFMEKECNRITKQLIENIAIRSLRRSENQIEDITFTDTEIIFEVFGTEIGETNEKDCID